MTAGRRKLYIAPLLFGGLVVVLAATLLTIGARSPFTHLNLSPNVVSGFDRTSQVVVGPPQPISAMQLQSSSKTSLALQGQSLFMSLDCASCHGLRGQGAVVGPVIAGANAATLKDKTTSGPGGMPKFTGLTDQDLNALAAYLAAVTKTSGAAH